MDRLRTGAIHVLLVSFVSLAVVNVLTGLPSPSKKRGTTCPATLDPDSSSQKPGPCRSAHIRRPGETTISTAANDKSHCFIAGRCHPNPPTAAMGRNPVTLAETAGDTRRRQPPRRPAGTSV
ncbi:hypothetical protein B0T11DRAFT_14748 [Plectosphaerella cucumerina]|uniref:Uncharacterized protein n=1 Tax=Plectosphaerella cucumerina TaxID=40658 RepID=A0A8K0X8J6_9PEZI|nr:hypothetical protein B0T11DRAFT_14748 [Plectosphaerella cucumerina]